MVEQVVVTGEPGEITIHPQSILEEVIQNVRMIVTTIRGTLPLDRDFGISNHLVDTPIERAKALISREIIEQVEKYEPRARITRVQFIEDFEAAADGRLIPKLQLTIKEERE